VFASSQDQCARRSPQTGAAFNFWHPDLVTLHVWLWYHNPGGLYSGTNPLVQPFNRGRQGAGGSQWRQNSLPSGSCMSTP
jgi:hypothetical protein